MQHVQRVRRVLQVQQVQRVQQVQQLQQAVAAPSDAQQSTEVAPADVELCAVENDILQLTVYATVTSEGARISPPHWGVTVEIPAGAVPAEKPLRELRHSASAGAPPEGLDTAHLVLWHLTQKVAADTEANQTSGVAHHAGRGARRVARRGALRGAALRRAAL